LYEIPLCDFQHIYGDSLPVPWSSLAWGSLTSPWLDDCAYCLVVFSHVFALLITPWLRFWMVGEHIISLWWFGIYAYLGHGQWPKPPKGLDDGVKREMFHDVVDVS
jgi:hypothetical protein